MRSIRIAGLILLAGTMAQAQPQQAQRPAQHPDSMGGGNCAQNVWNCKNTPNPLPHYDSVWVEELTWMDVRDAIKLGRNTVIIATGGVEPNGPFLATGKHNFVLKANCEAIARKMGTALCAPIVKFVPEGTIEPPSGHMTSPGTISLRQDTFEALLTDIAHSFKMHGFKNIVFIGDSGGNVTGMSRVAETLNQKWPDTTVAHIREHYDYASVAALLRELGIQPAKDDSLHDEPGITFNMMAGDPESVRYRERVKAGLASINGVSVADLDKSLEIARKIVDMRANNTIAAIKKAIETKGASTVQPASQRGNR